MAKQTLDLFKLFKLVVEKGGLVEVRGEQLFQNSFVLFGPLGYEILHGVFLIFFCQVINKKIWREIIKGLSLPASVTSAAFTLRTQ